MIDKNTLATIAKQLVGPGKGILAADESTGTMEKRLASVSVQSTESNRKAYREILFSTEGVENFISGVILYDETFRQGLGRILLDKGILIGIKVDTGTIDMPGLAGEKLTQGLEGLKNRCEEYQKMGASFTKWRAVFAIGQNIPSEKCLEENAEALAEYARIAQEAGLVPIVEPEVLMDGDHSLERCNQVTGETLKTVFAKLTEKQIFLGGMLLKPNMVLAGKDSLVQATVQQVAEATIKCFKRYVPNEVPGCVFLSGGLSPDEATERLRAINLMKGLSWQMSFSFGRALQQEVLLAWQGKPENKQKSQKAFYNRAEKVSLARSGR